MNQPENFETASVNTGLAPMEGVTGFPFRIWMWLCGSPESQGTPFLRVTGSWPSSLPGDWAPELSEEGMSQALPYKLMPQLMSPNAGQFIGTAEKILKVSPVVELNCGCPAPLVVGKGAGSGLLREPEVFHRFIEQSVRDLGPGVLSVKIRTGYEDANAWNQLVGGLQGLSLRRLVIHGRTRAERYTGLADWSLINDAATKLSVPVVGSGDITNLVTLKQRFETGHAVRGSMIGRGALRNPWIFKEIRDMAPVSLGFGALKDALISYFHLHELFLYDPARLKALCLEGHFRETAGTCPQRWQEIRLLLERVSVSGQPGAKGTGRSLGRLKLLWNYLRSSLPAPWFYPRLMRATSQESFLEGLSLLAKKASPEGGDLTLAWQGEYDWLYSGGKKPDSVSSLIQPG